MTTDISKSLLSKQCNRITRLTVWELTALQLELLDNRPAVSLRNVINGEIVTLTPETVLASDVFAGQKIKFVAAYLLGYSDQHHGYENDSIDNPEGYRQGRDGRYNDEAIGEAILHLASAIKYPKMCYQSAPNPLGTNIRPVRRDTIKTLPKFE